MRKKIPFRLLVFTLLLGFLAGCSGSSGVPSADFPASGAPPVRDRIGVKFHSGSGCPGGNGRARRIGEPAATRKPRQRRKPRAERIPGRRTGTSGFRGIPGRQSYADA
jgi:hypothetical protein